MGDCLAEATVVAFLDGSLPPEARVSVEEHVAACSACAELVTWAAADHSSATVGMPGRAGRPFVGQLSPGARVGRYQILGALGRGGMGEVYAAYHPDLDRRIAIKVVQGTGGRDGERRARLLREARTIARLSHPNVVSVHDAGTFDDRVFIVMELIDGQTIDVWLRAEPRTWRQILDVFIAAGRGLAAAHAAGIVHRDFKPQNVMIGRNGAVRVMDFGLARLAGEDAGNRCDGDADSPPLPILSVTKTGAVVGTPAYMSPEQFRREATDERSDQFSFCVALHEALYSTRPPAALSGSGSGSGSSAEAAVGELSKPAARGGAPLWLRHIVRRGASVNREQRFRSMEELIAALERGRTRLQRRASVLTVAVATLVMCAGAWRLGRGNRLICAVPTDRIAAAWSPGDDANPRRQSIHRAFTASGRAAAEMSWQRLSRVLDDYVNAWSTMYRQTCEATHQRGEQSAEVLDLRMSCLGDDLDQVRALTDALVTADASVVSRAVSAARELTPVSRCADVALLRAAVPLPRDEKTLREVQRLRRGIAELEALRVVGRTDAALTRAIALRPEIEATRYQPLLAELLEKMGVIESSQHLDAAEATLEDALYNAEAAHDDVTAARAAASLIYTVGLDHGRLRESERWARLANAILDRLGPGQARIRGWVLQDRAAVLVANGDLSTAMELVEKAIALKEQALGKEHPDVAISLDGAGWALVQLGRPQEALERIDRAIWIYENHGDPNSQPLAGALLNKGEALLALGRTRDARAAYERADKILKTEPGSSMPNIADVLAGFGRIELAEGNPALAVPLLERGLEIYRRYSGYASIIAEIEFALARALWQSSGDRRQARAHATEARDIYRRLHDARRLESTVAWLAANHTT